MQLCTAVFPIIYTYFSDLWKIIPVPLLSSFRKNPCCRYKHPCFGLLIRCTNVIFFLSNSHSIFLPPHLLLVPGYFYLGCSDSHTFENLAIWNQEMTCYNFPHWSLQQKYIKSACPVVRACLALSYIQCKLSSLDT